MQTVDQNQIVQLVSADDCGSGRTPRVDDAVRIALPPGRTCPECPHVDGESGRTGRVVTVRAPLGAPSHPYLVLLDRAPIGEDLVDRRLAIRARHYAADELEPIA